MNGPAVVVPQPMQPLISPANVKDSRWLTLEVCREYIRNKCTRSDQECKFAHPPAHVEVQNGRVTCCFDSIKGKCQRKDPPCKYLHPPQHLKEQLLQNGRNNLILRNLQWQALTGGLQPGVAPTVMYDAASTNGKPAVFSNAVYAPTQQPTWPSGYMFPGALALNTAYISPGAAAGSGHTMVPSILSQSLDTASTALPVSVSSPSQLGTVAAHTTSITPKMARADRLESSTAVSASSGVMSNSWNGHTTHVSPADTPVVSSASHYNTPVYFQAPPMVEVIGASNKRTRDPSDDLLLSMNPVSGMVPIVKRSAVDGKSGMAVYPSAPTGASYQQALAAMQIHQQQYVPVTIAGHPPGVPRF